jgi:hypothetical protein
MIAQITHIKKVSQIIRRPGLTATASNELRSKITNNTIVSLSVPFHSFFLHSCREVSKLQKIQM